MHPTLVTLLQQRCDPITLAQRVLDECFGGDATDLVVRVVGNDIELLKRVGGGSVTIICDTDNDLAIELRGDWGFRSIEIDDCPERWALLRELIYDHLGEVN